MKTQNFKIAFIVLFFFRLFIVTSELITLVGDQNAGNIGESNEVEDEMKLIDLPTLMSQGTEAYHKATLPGNIATYMYKFEIINKSGRFYRVRINTIGAPRDWANLINDSKVEITVEMAIIVVGCVTADIELENQTRRVDLWGCSIPKWLN
ncbi:hypothetical protein BB560_005937, partial [Smittium megazygosporum]